MSSNNNSPIEQIQIPVPIRKNSKNKSLIETPTLMLDDRFQISILTEENFEEAFECFLTGYLDAHPIFKSLEVSKDDLSTFFKDKLYQAMYQRPYLQIISKDLQRQGKIVGVFLTRHFIDTPENEEIFAKKLNQIAKKCPKMAKKFEMDARINTEEILKPYIDEVRQSGNLMLYQQCYVSVLPEYQKTKLFAKMLEIIYHNSQQINVKGFIDMVYNQATRNMSVQLGGKILNELDIKKETYEGKAIFSSNKSAACGLTYTDFSSQFAKKTLNNPKYEQFYQQLKLYLEYKQIKQQQMLNKQLIKIQQRPSL